MVTAYPNRTSPVLRGALHSRKHHRHAALAAAAERPALQGKQGRRSGRIRSARSWSSIAPIPPATPATASWTRSGFSLENFDTIGAWRTKDRFAGTVIDASGKLVDGTAVNGPDDLRNALMKRPEQFVETMTEKLLIYGLGRTLEPYDMPTIRKIVRDAAADKYRFSSLVMGIVTSPPFQMSRVPQAQQPAEQVAGAARP